MEHPRADSEREGVAEIGGQAMTREEAIKSLQNIIEYWTYKPTEGEAAKMAIAALRPVSREQVKRALAMMWFAYVNSDKETPHSYEADALEEAESILGPWAECMPKYLKRGPEEG